MKNMKDFLNMYLKVYVLLLADVFENFTNDSINSFELDPAHYLFTPGFSWNVMLRVKGVNLKLISDMEKYQFIKSMIKGGGISMICKCYAKGNNKFLKS